MQIPSTPETIARVQPLIDYIRHIAPVSKEIEKYIHRTCYPKTLLRGKFLLKPGDLCQHYYYIHKGLLRAYINYGGKEVTTWINPEYEITTSIRSMSDNAPSNEYIQALEDSELVVIPFDALTYLYDHYPAINQIGRILLEQYYIASDDRAFIGRIPNAETRYRHFLQSTPELINRVPAKYIASYLGMTEETLSRLRKKISTVKK